MEIRKAADADYDDYCRIVAEVDELHATRAPRHFRLPQPPGRPREYYQSVLADPEQAIFMAVREGALLGYVHASMRQTRDVPVLVQRRFGYISDIVVSAPFRRQGVGRALMQKAREWVIEMGGTEIGLAVSAFNEAAMKMYEAEGFRVKHREMYLPLD